MTSGSTTRKHGIVVTSEPRADGRLSLVCVDLKAMTCVTSYGELLQMEYDGLAWIALEACQGSWPLLIRTWPVLGGTRLVELHRSSEKPVPPSDSMDQTAF